MVVISENLEAGSSSTPSTAEKAFPSGIRVLLVDDDPICLIDLETILQKNKYEVVAVRDGIEALTTLRKKKGTFDLVITDVHMPRMDGFELLDQIGREFKIPVIMMSDSDEMNIATRGLERGACFFLLKPVTEAGIQNIWQHVYRKKREELIEMEETGSVRESSAPHSSVRQRSRNRSRARPRNRGIVIEDVDPDSATSSVNERASSRLLRDRNKRKERENDEDGRGADENDDDLIDGHRRRGHAHKKARVVWNTDLHNQFLDAIDRLTIEKAVPKKILELMSVPGLTRENVASHLQKYRLFVKKVVEANQAKEPGAAMSLATGVLKSSFANGHSASSLLTNIQQRSGEATGGGGGGLLTDTATAAATTQRSSLTPTYPPGSSSNGYYGRNNNNYLTGTTSNNATINLRTPYSSAGGSTSRWYNRTAGYGSYNLGTNLSTAAAATITAAPQLQYGQSSLTLSNNNNNTQGGGLGVFIQPSWLAGSTSTSPSLFNQQNAGNNSTLPSLFNQQNAASNYTQPSLFIQQNASTSAPPSLFNQQNASTSTPPSLLNQQNANSTGRYPSLSSSSFGIDHQPHYGLRTPNGTYYGSSSTSSRDTALMPNMPIHQQSQLTIGQQPRNLGTAPLEHNLNQLTIGQQPRNLGTAPLENNLNQLTIGQQQPRNFGTGPLENNLNQLTIGQQQPRNFGTGPLEDNLDQLTIGQPRNFDTGPLEHNLNIWNQRQEQLNNTVGAGNLGGSGSSSNYGNINLTQTPNFNSTTDTNFNYAGGIQIGNNNLGSSMESGETNQNIGGMFFPELSANRSNDVNLSYSNLLMTNENLISRNAIEKTPLHQEGQVQGSPSTTSSPPGQTFGLMMNSGYGTQDNVQVAASSPPGQTFGLMMNSGYGTQDNVQVAASSGYTGANNNHLSASMFITNNAITSEQDYSPPVSAPQPEEDAEHEEFSEIYNLLRSNSAAADELNSLPQLFDDEGELGDFLFKQFDEHTAANQHSYGEEVIDPNFDISAYQMDGGI